MTLDELVTSLQESYIGEYRTDKTELPPILLLPSEITVDVFAICVELTDVASWKTLQNLSHVCSLWRTLITQTPQLWMSLSYSWYRCDYGFSKILAEHIVRSNQSPLSLSLAVTSRDNMREGIFDVIAPAFHRLRAFHFTDAKFKDLAQLSQLSRYENIFPLLESLSFSHDILDEDGDAEHPFDPIILQTPILHDLTMSDIPAKFLEVTLAQAKTVTWHDTDYDPNAVKHVLLQCSNAETVDLMLRGWGATLRLSSSDSSTPAPMTVLPRLKSLFIEITNIEKADASPLFQSIYTPNLRHLRVKAEKDIAGWKQHSFVQFAARSLQNLVVLELSFSNPTSEMLPAIFAHCPNVEEFTSNALHQNVDLVLTSLISSALPRLTKVQILGLSMYISIEVFKLFLEDRWTHARRAGHLSRVNELKIECMLMYWAWMNPLRQELDAEASSYREEGMKIEFGAIYNLEGEHD